MLAVYAGKRQKDGSGGVSPLSKLLSPTLMILGLDFRLSSPGRAQTLLPHCGTPQGRHDST